MRPVVQTLKKGGKIFFMIKKRIKIKKLNQKMKELRETYLTKFQYLITFSCFFFASFYNIFVFVFSIEIKMRGVYVGGNERV